MDVDRFAPQGGGVITPRNQGTSGEYVNTVDIIIQGPAKYMPVQIDCST